MTITLNRVSVHRGRGRSRAPLLTISAAIILGIISAMSVTGIWGWKV